MKHNRVEPGGVKTREYSTLIQDFLVEWFGSEPRELGTPSRWLVSEPSELIKLASESISPLYMSVNYYSARDTVSRLDKLFFDFDSQDLSLAWKEVVDFSDNMNRFYGLKPLIAFSGRKGYHSYLFFQHPFGWDLSQRHLKAIYSELQAMLLYGLEYETLDHAVIGDIKRLARVPFSRHEKSGELCQPLDMSRSPVLLQPGFKQAFREHGIGMDLIKKALNRVNDEILDKAFPKPRRRRPTYDDRIRPCIEAALGSSHVEHKLRIAVVAELRAHGWGEARIVDAFSGLGDFDRKKTARYVKHALKKGYKPFRCSTIQILGGCLGTECRFYRRRRS